MENLFSGQGDLKMKRHSIFASTFQEKGVWRSWYRVRLACGRYRDRNPASPFFFLLFYPLFAAVEVRLGREWDLFVFSSGTFAMSKVVQAKHEVCLNLKSFFITSTTIFFSIFPPPNICEMSQSKREKLIFWYYLGYDLPKKKFSESQKRKLNSQEGGYKNLIPIRKEKKIKKKLFSPTKALTHSQTKKNSHPILPISKKKKIRNFFYDVLCTFDGS